MEDLKPKGTLLTITLMIVGLLAQAQVGYYDNTFYQGMGMDVKCTGGLVQPDNSIIVVGKFSYMHERSIKGIAKLNYDGTNDYSFNPGAGADDYVNVVVRQPDGKLIITGEFVKFNNVTLNRIARLNPDGTRDATFTTGTGFNGAIYATTLQPDGKILVGGQFTQFNGVPVNNLARLNSNGTLDNTFNTGAGCSASVFAIELQPDGKIVVGGDFQNYDNNPVGRIVRIHANGAIDNTFQLGGAGANSIVTSLGIQADGKIVAAGYFTTYNTVTTGRIKRLNTDGSEDGSFNVGPGFNDYINELVLQPDGKIVVTGNFITCSGNQAVRLARLNTDGTFDNTFTVGQGANQRANALFLDANGKVYVGGFFTSFNSFARYRLARVNTDGSVDHSFFGESKLNGQVFAATFQSNGKAIVAGQFNLHNQTPANRIVRLNSAGNIDNSFNSGIGANGTIRTVAVTGTDQIIIAGEFTSYNGVPVNRIARLNSDGTLDASFNTGAGFNSTVYSVVVSNGKIYVGGNFTRYNNVTTNRIVRLNADGSIDNTFNTGSAANNIVYRVAMQADGKILIGGTFTTYASQSARRLARINTDGTLDATFTVGAGPDNAVYTIALQADGKILVGGNFTKYNNVSKLKVARVNTDGTLDATFTTRVNNGAVNDIAPAYNGVLLAGTFTRINNVNTSRIGYVNTTGTLSNDLYTGSGASGGVYAIAIDRNERKIVVGGDFESFQSHLSSRVARMGYTNITLSPMADLPCPGTTATLGYDKLKNFVAGNEFKVELSDANGNFDSVLVIGSSASHVAGTDVLPLSIPTTVTAGNNYRIRVISTNPVDTARISNAFVISAPTPPTINYTGDKNFCRGGSLTLQSSPGLNYVWSTGDTTQQITVENTAQYTVSVVDQNNCTATSAPLSVVVYPSPDSTVNVAAASLCNGGSLRLSAASGLTYHWSNGSQASSIVVNQSATYSVTVSNNYGCQSDSTITIDLSAFYNNLIKTYGATTFCPGGNVTLKATLPNFNYLWSNQATTQGIVVANSGNYTVTISDGTCSMTATVPVTVHPVPYRHISPGDEAVFCQGGSVMLSAAAGLTYEWNNGSTAQDITVNTPGIYYATLTDPATGCTAISDTVAVSETICSGLEETTQAGWQVYPNPVRDVLNIATNNSAQAATIYIYDIAGQLVFSTVTPAFEKVSINVAALAPGAYLLQANGYQHKFIKAE